VLIDNLESTITLHPVTHSLWFWIKISASESIQLHNYGCNGPEAVVTRG